MGAGRILSEVGEGLYQVKLIFGDQLDTRLEALATKRTKLEEELLQLRAAQLDLIAIWADAYNDLRDKIAAWEAGIEMPEEPVMKPPDMKVSTYEWMMRTAPKIGLPDYLVAAFTRLGTASKNKAAGERSIADKQAEYLALIKKQTELTALKDTEEEGISAWCADYTEGLTGTVDIATLEVFGEYDPPIGGGVNIKPGFSSAAWAARYGKLQRSVVLSESGFAWNFTMLNPWEKWMPNWRYATVIGVNTDSLNLELLPVISGTRSYLAKLNTLNDPWVSAMVNVPVTYMYSNAAAFEVNDEVVVEFTKRISGSREFYEPKVIGFKDHPKARPLILCRKQSDPAGLRLLKAGNIFAASFTSTGHINWQGTYGVLSWTGPSNRYGRSSTAWTAAIYKYGKLFITAPFVVLGAAIMKVGNIKYVNIICANSSTDTIIAYQVNLQTAIGTQLASFDFTPYYRAWHFNASGTEAVSLRFDNSIPLEEKVRAVFFVGTAFINNLGPKMSLGVLPAKTVFEQSYTWAMDGEGNYVNNITITETYDGTVENEQYIAVDYRGDLEIAATIKTTREKNVIEQHFSSIPLRTASKAGSEVQNEYLLFNGITIAEGEKKEEYDFEEIDEPLFDGTHLTTTTSSLFNIINMDLRSELVLLQREIINKTDSEHGYDSNGEFLFVYDKTVNINSTHIMQIISNGTTGLLSLEQTSQVIGSPVYTIYWWLIYAYGGPPDPPPSSGSSSTTTITNSYYSASEISWSYPAQISSFSSVSNLDNDESAATVYARFRDITTTSSYFAYFRQNWYSAGDLNALLGLTGILSPEPLRIIG